MYVKETLTQVYTKDTKEKPFACGLCQKAFSRKDTFKTHLGTNSGEKPYPYNQCRLFEQWWFEETFDNTLK